MGVKYLVAIALLVGLFIWFTHRSATPRDREPGAAKKEVASASVEKAGTPSPSRSPSAIRAPIVRTQQVLDKVKEFQREGE